MDDRTVDRLHSMLLLDELPAFSDEELEQWVGPNAKKYHPIRAILTAMLMKAHSENRKERALAKPILVREGRLILNDCSVHGFSYEAARLEAKGEMDWNQHDQWACAFGQLSDKFEIARDTIKTLARELEDCTHGDECPAYECAYGECMCEIKPELLDENGELPDDHEEDFLNDRDHVDCECGTGRLQDIIEEARVRIGGLD